MEAQIENKPRLDFKILTIEDHAVQRAIERFKRKDKQDALNYCKCLLGAAQYIGETTCERGNRTHMFVAPNKVAIYITLDCRVVKTLMKVTDKPYIVYDKTEPKNTNENIFTELKEIPLQDKLIKLYQTEFKKHDRLEKKMIKEFTEYKLTQSIVLAELRLQEYRTKKKREKQELADEITQIEESFISNETELRRVQGDKRKISRALSTLLMN